MMMMMTDTISLSHFLLIKHYSSPAWAGCTTIQKYWQVLASLFLPGDCRYCQPGSFPKISQWRDIRKLMNHSTRNVCSFSFISAKHERGEYVYSVLGMQQQCCSGTGNISALTGWSCVWVCQILNGNSGLSKEESELQLSLFSA